MKDRVAASFSNAALEYIENARQNAYDEVGQPPHEYETPEDELARYWKAWLSAAMSTIDSYIDDGASDDDIQAACEDLRGELPEWVLKPEPAKKRVRRKKLSAQKDTQMNDIVQRLNARKQARTQILTRDIKAAMRWDNTKQDDVDGKPIGDRHPGHAAVAAVEEALAQFNIPSNASVKLGRTQRKSGHGAHHISEGRVDVLLTLHSVSGPAHHVTIPVVIKQGRVLEPMVLLDHGVERVITQNTIDDIVERGEFRMAAPDRMTMFHSPVEGASRHQVSISHPGVFAVTPSRILITSALTGRRKHAGDDIEVDADLDKDSGWKENLALAVGIGGAAGPAMAGPPGSYQPNTNVRETNTNVFQQGTKPGIDNTKVFQHGNALDNVQQSNIKAYDAEMKKLDAKYTADTKLLSLYNDGKAAGALDDVEAQKAAYGKVLDQWNAKKVSHDALLAFKDGFKNAQLRSKIDSELENLDEAARAPALQKLLAPAPKKGRKAFYEPRVVGDIGVTGPEVPRADGDFLDVAERGIGDFAPFQVVRTSVEFGARNRGGGEYLIPKGEKGVIERDVDGAGFAYVVRFDELGYAVTVPAWALKGGKSAGWKENLLALGLGAAGTGDMNPNALPSGMTMGYDSPVPIELRHQEDAQEGEWMEAPDPDAGPRYMQKHKTPHEKLKDIYDVAKGAVDNVSSHKLPFAKERGAMLRRADGEESECPFCGFDKFDETGLCARCDQNPEDFVEGYHDDAAMLEDSMYLREAARIKVKPPGGKFWQRLEVIVPQSYNDPEWVQRQVDKFWNQVQGAPEQRAQQIINKVIRDSAEEHKRIRPQNQRGPDPSARPAPEKKVMTAPSEPKVAPKPLLRSVTKPPTEVAREVTDPANAPRKVRDPAEVSSLANDPWFAKSKSNFRERMFGPRQRAAAWSLPQG